MKIIFFGLGSIGQRHLRILLKNYKHEIFAFRTNKGQEKNEFNVKEIYGWNEFEHIAPDIAFITNPSFMHIDVAIECTKRNCSLFIEKPLGSSITGLDSLLNLVKQHNLSTYVAYNLRFHPIIEYLKNQVTKYKLAHLNILSSSFLPLWRPAQDYRKSYSSSSKLGGGVILELSHEIDYTKYLLGDIINISGHYGKMSNLEILCEDFADILIQSNNNAYANIHINFASHLPERIIKAEFEDFTICGDLINGVIKKYSREKLDEEIIINIDHNNTYEKQLDYFFNNFNPNMMNNIFEASVLFKKIISYKKNVRTKNMLHR